MVCLPHIKIPKTELHKKAEGQRDEPSCSEDAPELTRSSSPSPKHGLLQIFTTILHIIGLSALGGAVFLQVLVAFSMLVNDGFIGFEFNLFILSLEMAFAIIAVPYFIYIYISISIIQK
jgi:hypothetical protein